KRIGEKIKEIENYLEKVDAKLKDREFVLHAPQELIEREKKRREALEREREKWEKHLQEIKI
ncbi:MAG: hypothetical protein NC821_05180, partial [Candidatus Omnitrophica bacterium]|nr:hypothetical protein [Candidatus Omnitrophota bacterium]